MPVYMRLSCGDRLPVAPRGNFLYEQKVTKESHRERVFRLPPLPVNPHPQQQRETVRGFPLIPSGGAMDEQRRLVSNSVNEQVFLLNA